MKQTRQLLFVIFLILFSSACRQAGDEPEISTDQAPNITTGMLQHTVYFYLNEEVTDEEKQQFEEGLEELLSIEEIFKSDMGVPASTPERDVTDHSFGYSIFVWFETMEDYSVYADHPIHLDFIEKYEHLWADVKVYDSEIIQTLD
ncbi:Dabb family protein [Rhodohalobacter sp. 614A]|uniref:Dabb family protein n=1 Tax=Rhodohalobacter sp. 614A TaxID=2908649 RepID=UPI001F330A5B|nr:Dabb family protein [Rhodohalobacter sp. 614A]